MEDDYICSTNLCALCNDVGESVNASLVCKEEHIYLCDPCGRRHKIQRATKSHKVITIEEDRAKEVLCELCLGENERVPAYGYCETCEDPEYMCRSCSKRHTASKIFKSHSINTDLETRPNDSQSSAQVSIIFNNSSMDSNSMYSNEMKYRNHLDAPKLIYIRIKQF
ncbi:Tripartite motif-containing protein 45 [Bonamia ostreae]|uniref:Tripartite motif-containing protein 45 n=1 Tax=Bonamia ostreae TaxID=126728 RepID=A0ABV2ARH4_9EUKA